MTVGELIEGLRGFDPSAAVVVVEPPLNTVFPVIRCQQGVVMGRPAVRLFTQYACWTPSEDTGGE